MKTILHKDFLLTNKIEVSKLPDHLKGAIRVFDRLNRLEVEESAEKRKLAQELKELDQEIYAELLEEFQDDLRNNELKDMHIKPLSDEEILEKLYKSSEKGLARTRSRLAEFGLRAQLYKRSHQIGDFQLKRSSLFSYTYTITKNKPKNEK